MAIFRHLCYRVLHKDVSLSDGCHWGDDRQRAMIDRETIRWKMRPSKQVAWVKKQK